MPKKGNVPWNKGLHDGTCKGFTGKHTPETREKMSRRKLDNPSPGMTGKRHTKESINKMSINRSGAPAWNKGMEMPQSFCDTMSKVQEGKTIPQIVRDKISNSLKEYEFTPEHRENISKSLMNREYSEETILKLIESHLGGFWMGNIRYSTAPIYCEKWKDVNPRVHAFFDYKCVECGAHENGRSHIGHHVFYEKLACCWCNDEGIYYTNLNARNHKEKDFCIGENPNYFVILCPSCHGKTGGNFINRQDWANHFKRIIDERHGGKSYFTKEEMGQMAPSN